MFRKLLQYIYKFFTNRPPSVIGSMSDYQWLKQEDIIEDEGQWTLYTNKYKEIYNEVMKDIPIEVFCKAYANEIKRFLDEEGDDIFYQNLDDFLENEPLQHNYNLRSLKQREQQRNYARDAGFMKKS